MPHPTIPRDHSGHTPAQVRALARAASTPRSRYVPTDRVFRNAFEAELVATEELMAAKVDALLALIHESERSMGRAAIARLDNAARAALRADNHPAGPETDPAA